MLDLINPAQTLLWHCGWLDAAPPSGHVYYGPNHSVIEIIKLRGEILSSQLHHIRVTAGTHHVTANFVLDHMNPTQTFLGLCGWLDIAPPMGGVNSKFRLAKVGVILPSVQCWCQIFVGSCQPAWTLHWLCGCLDVRLLWDVCTLALIFSHGDCKMRGGCYPQGYIGRARPWVLTVCRLSFILHLNLHHKRLMVNSAFL